MILWQMHGMHETQEIHNHNVTTSIKDINNELKYINFKFTN